MMMIFSAFWNSSIYTFSLILITSSSLRSQYNPTIESMLTRANQLLYASNYIEAIQEYDAILQSKPDKDILLAVYYNRAQAYDGMGKYSSAAQSYQRIIEIDPRFKKGEIYYQQGQVYQLARMHSQSRQAYQTFLQFFPNHSECHLNLGQVLEILGEQQKAVKSYDKAIEYKPNYSKAYLLKISILKKLKRFEDILKACSAALHNEPTDFEILYEEGFGLISLQRYRQAIESLKDCIRYNKKYVKAYIALADCYHKLERNQEGLDILNNCLDCNKDVIKSIEKKEIKILIGTIYMHGKQYKAAIDCFREVLSQRPISENVKIKLAYCLEQYGNHFLNIKQFSDSLTCYSQALKYDPNKNSILTNQGVAYQNINDYESAERCFNLVLSKEPNNVTALNNLASLYHIRGNSERCQQIFQRLAQQNPNNIEFHINNGRNYFTLRKYNEAYTEFSKALSTSPSSNNYNLFNSLAVTLEKLDRNQQALKYANMANDLTKNRSPLFLLNRASILMNLQKIGLAKQDFDRAAEQLRNPDKKYLMQLGLNVDNLKYMFNQLNHYAYLMTPINDFRKQITDQINEAPIQDKEIYSKIVETVQKAEEYAMSRIITQINKEIPQESPNPEESRQDYNTIVKFMQDAKQMMASQKQQIDRLSIEVEMLRKDSQKNREIFNYLPQSMSLKQKLQSLYDNDQKEIWMYGKQLYWILNGYLKSYMLISTGMIARGQENVNRSTFSKALKKVCGIAQFAKNIPVIGDFSQLISRVCGLFVDMEDEAIIEQMYKVISYNYDTEEDLNDEICESVLLVLNCPQKIQKIKEHLVFKPSQGLIQSIKEKIEDVMAWFAQKKNQFVMHMRGFQKAENIIQSELAVIDVGAIISILLGMKISPVQKNRVIKNAAKRMSIGDKVERMVLEAYQRQNENLRVSNNSFCMVMRCFIVYDNPLLNNRDFLHHASKKNIMKKVHSLASEKYAKVRLLLMESDYKAIEKLLL